MDGPYNIIDIRQPRNRGDKWRYNIEDADGKVTRNVDGDTFL